MTQAMDITVLMDEPWIPRDDPDFTRNTEETQTERHVVMALRELGHRVRILGVGYDVAGIVRDLTDHPPDMVFNLAEQFAEDRRLDKDVAGLLDMMQIRFTGCGSAGLMLCRDKGLCKQLLGLHRIRIPGFAMLRPGKTARIPKSLRFPLIVKPLHEDGSTGISKASIVQDAEQALQRAELIWNQWQQHSIAEEYVEGRELYVGVLGNKRLSALPPRELYFDDTSNGGPSIATYRVKYDDEYRERWNIRYGFAELDDDVLARIARVAKRVFRILQMKDYCRIDLRLTPDGRIVILEVNPNPDIGYGEDFAESAERAGIEYNDLIGRILTLAKRRYEQ